MSQSELFDVDQDTAAQIGRFNAKNIDRLHGCAELSPRLAQLAFSFPVLFFALASAYGPLAARREAIQLAVDGCALSRVAGAVGLPMCLRRLPPEACKAKLPHVVWGQGAGKVLGPLIPKDDRTAQGWLVGVFFAARTGGEAIAIWLARHHKLFANGMADYRCLVPLIIYAWYSIHRPDLLGKAALWTVDLDVATALVRAVTWFKSVKLMADVGPDGVACGWLPGCVIEGLEFVPLTRVETVHAEGDVMGHCVIEYGEGLARDICRIFAVRQGGSPLATMEVRPCVRTRRPAVVQLKGPGNGSCSLELWHAANAFVEAHKDLALPGRLPVAPLSQQRLTEFLQPYRESLPEGDRRWVESLTFRRLQDDVGQLGRLVGGAPRWLQWT